MNALQYKVKCLTYGRTCRIFIASSLYRGCAMHTLQSHSKIVNLIPFTRWQHHNDDCCMDSRRWLVSSPHYRSRLPSIFTKPTTNQRRRKQIESGGHEFRREASENFFYYAPPLFCSAPQREGALLTPGWAQRCAIILSVRKRTGL